MVSPYGLKIAALRFKIRELKIKMAIAIKMIFDSLFYLLC